MALRLCSAFIHLTVLLTTYYSQNYSQTPNLFCPKNRTALVVIVSTTEYRFSRHRERVLSSRHRRVGIRSPTILACDRVKHIITICVEGNRCALYDAWVVICDLWTNRIPTHHTRGVCVRCVREDVQRRRPTAPCRYIVYRAHKSRRKCQRRRGAALCADRVRYARQFCICH